MNWEVLHGTDVIGSVDASDAMEATERASKKWPLVSDLVVRVPGPDADAISRAIRQVLQQQKGNRR